MVNVNTNNAKQSNSISDLLTKSVNTRTYNVLIEKEVGTKCAIMLNQIQYWITIYSDDDHFYDGQYWIHETYQEWNEQFPEWGFSTIRRVLEKLEDKNLIRVGNFNKMKNDHTKWYTINEERVREVLENVSPVQNEQAACSKRTGLPAQNEQAGLSKMDKALPNISTNNSSNISTTKNSSSVCSSCNIDIYNTSPTEDRKDKEEYTLRISELRDKLFDMYGFAVDFINDLEKVIMYFIRKYLDTTKAEFHGIQTDEPFEVPTEKIASVLSQIGKDKMFELIDMYFKDSQFPPDRLPYSHFATYGITEDRIQEKERRRKEAHMMAIEAGVPDFPIPFRY